MMDSNKAELLELSTVNRPTNSSPSTKAMDKPTPMASDNEKLPEHASAVEVAPATVKNIKQKRSFLLKFKCFRAPLLITVTCIAYLGISLGTLDIGLQGILGNIKTHQQEAETRLWATQNKYHQERMLVHRLNSLLESSLPKAFCETHPECLERGLRIIQQHFFSFEYEQYPDILSETISWVQHNCDKLQFTPQTLHPRTPQELVLHNWAIVRYEAGKAFSLLKSKVALLGKWIRWKWNGEEPTMHKTHKYEQASKEPDIVLPSNFKLVSDVGTVYRLVHNPPSNYFVNTVAVSQKAVIEATHRVVSLNTMIKRISNYAHFNTILRLYVFAPLELALLLAIMLCDYYDLDSRITRATFSHINWSEASKLVLELKYHEKYLGESMLRQIGVIATRIIMEGYLNRGGHGIIDGGLVMMVISLCLLVNFCVPKNRIENISSFCKAIKEIHQIWQREPDTSSHIESKDKLKFKTNIKHLKMGTTRQATSTPTSLHLQVSPETTLQEDIQHTLQAIRQEKIISAAPRVANYDDGPDFDSDADSMASTTSDWSILEDKSKEWDFQKASS